MIVSVSVADTTGFNWNTGVVSHTGAGYAQINGEILYYYNSITAGVSPAGTLGIGSRGVDSIQQSTFNVGTQIFPYELNGVTVYIESIIKHIHLPSQHFTKIGARY